MSFYEHDISKQTQSSGNKICISNIFNAIISHIFFKATYRANHCIRKKTLVSKFKKATGQWTLGWPIKLNVKCPDVYYIQLHNILTLASFIFFHFQQMHIIEITLEMVFGNRSHWTFQERDLHMKHLPISITSAGHFCLGEPADMSPIALSIS